MRFPRVAVVAGLVVATVGCASERPSPSAEPSPTIGGGSFRCEAVELRGPNGARIDLTGTWQGAETLWLVTQSGSCVVIEGLSRLGGQRNGEEHRFVFTGDLRSDFSIVGRWTWTWACTGPECPTRGETTNIELQVGFDNDGQPAIDVPWAVVFGGLEPTFSVTLERVSLSTELPDS
jgi:hypothetical protein